MTTEKSVPLIVLSNGTKIPQLGLGTYRLAEGDEAYNSVLTALKAGYRHIDTAHAYQNERSVGKAIKDSGIPRDQIWLTSKLWPNEYGEGKTLKAIDRMLARLGVDYLDLVYFHQPVGDYIGGWKEMETALKSGKVKSIGFCNFDNDEVFEPFLENVNIENYKVISYNYNAAWTDSTDSSTAVLTNKNRLQFSLPMKAEYYEGGSNSAIIAYAAIYYDGEGWILSDNYVPYIYNLSDQTTTTEGKIGGKEETAPD